MTSDLPVVPSIRAMQRVCNQQQDVLRALSVHLRNPRRRTETSLSSLAQVLLVLPVAKATPDDMEAVLAARSHRSPTLMVLLQWPDGFLATVHVAWLQPRDGSAGWHPVSMASGRVGKSLLRLRESLATSRAFIFTVPALRIHALVEPGTSIALLHSGNTRLISGRKLKFETFVNRIRAEHDGLVAAHLRSAKLVAIQPAQGSTRKRSGVRPRKLG
jgi:hypothetical protein